MVLEAVGLLTPSVTVKSKLAFKFSLPFCTKCTLPALIWACVKVFETFQTLPSYTSSLPFIKLLVLYIATLESESTIFKSAEERVYSPEI